MKKTIAYIDGFNLYYGLLQKMPSYKWLDPSALVKALLRDDHDVIGIKFFTARIRPYPFDAAAINRQDIYLKAISQCKGVSVVEGYATRYGYRIFQGNAGRVQILAMALHMS